MDTHVMTWRDMRRQFGHMGQSGAQYPKRYPGVLNRTREGVGESPLKCCIHGVICVTRGTNDPCAAWPVEALQNCYQTGCPEDAVWTTYI